MKRLWHGKADTVTLGPVQCQGCRRFVVLVRGEWRDAIPERQRDWHERRFVGVHVCPAFPLYQLTA